MSSSEIADLAQRLFTQTRRIMEINNLSTVTKEVIETARESLSRDTLAGTRRPP